ncbi:leukocyte receptor cluster member 1 [Helicostylum pulchrum]|nr:leukocyte receptor cluster member 1 [Helicostylum pulchrum]
MNILHHKSYHVYNKKNIEKVKRDEAEAEKQEKEKQDRITLAESEARLDLLRKKANVKLPNDQVTNPVQHINLFEHAVVKGNPEHEAELQEEKEKWNKQITMYLGHGAKKEDDPWYAKKDDKAVKYKDTTTFKSKHKDKKIYKKGPIKLIEDPLELIKTQLQEREKRERKLERKFRPKKPSPSPKSKSKSSSSPSIEALRAKRLERENNEKFRLKQLYLDPEQDTECVDERKRSYNSQFNRQETEQAHNKRRR